MFLNMKRFAILLLFITIGFGLQAEALRNIGFLSMDNVNGDPQYDYLEGIIRGILLFDLGSEEELDLVVRSQLDAVLAEQKLRLTGLVTDDAVEVGQLVGADFLITGEYIFLGEEVMVNLSLIDVKNGTSSAYRVRGNTENFLHKLAEELILDILGKEVVLQGSDGERSIISLRDLEPGSLALYSHLIDAEVLLNGEFVSYTTGYRNIPLILEDLTPGEYTIEIKLIQFGVVDLPEFTFHPYKETIIIEPGKRLTLRPDIRHYNEWIYAEKVIYNEGWYFDTLEEQQPSIVDEDISYLNRQGEKVEVHIRIDLYNGAPRKSMEVYVTYQGEEHKAVLEANESGYFDSEENIGDIKLDLDISRTKFTLKVSRTDLWEGMQYEE